MKPSPFVLAGSAIALSIFLLIAKIIGACTGELLTESRSSTQADPGNSAKPGTSSVPAAPQMPPEPRLLTWHDPNTLIVAYKDSIHLYDAKTHKLGKRIVDRFAAVEWRGSNCFQPAGGRFFLREPTSILTDSSSPQEPSGPLSRLISDWSQPSSVIDSADEFSRWDTNPLDCQPFDYTLSKVREKAFDQQRRSVQSNRALLSKADGDGIVTVPNHPSSPEGRKLSLYQGRSIKPYRELLLPSADGSGRHSVSTDVSSFRDIDGSYVIYEVNTNFDKSSGSWPLSAWRLSPDLLAFQTIALPAGPWVKFHGFLKKSSCFSCGCSCYSHFSLMGAHGRLYAHVYGMAVDDRGAGIFSLSQSHGRPSWERIIKGNFEGPVLLSPDGCKVAYSDSEKRLRVATTGDCRA